MRNYQENQWRQSPVPSLYSRIKTFKIAVNSYAEAVIKVFCSCPILLSNFSDVEKSDPVAPAEKIINPILPYYTNKHRLTFYLFLLISQTFVEFKMYVKLKRFLRSSLSLCLFANFIFCRIFISGKCSSTLASTNLHRSLHAVFCRVCCREPTQNRNDCCREILRLDFVTSIMFLHGKKAGI